MGILMAVAIPAVSRTITNTRKDTYLNTAKQYVNQVKTLWAADGLKCGTKNSSVAPDGEYYIVTSSSNDNLLEEGGTSPWKNDTKGYVIVKRSGGKNTYYVYLVDEVGNAIGELSVVKDASGAVTSRTFHVVQSDKLTRTHADVTTLDNGFYDDFASTITSVTDSDSDSHDGLTECTVQ